jgi:hypothetical protein
MKGRYEREHGKSVVNITPSEIIERIVLLDFIHRLVSQKLRNKMYIPKNHNTHVQNSHKGQLLV